MVFSFIKHDQDIVGEGMPSRSTNDPNKLQRRRLSVLSPNKEWTSSIPVLRSGLLHKEKSSMLQFEKAPSPERFFSPSREGRETRKGARPFTTVLRRFCAWWGRGSRRGSI